ncbi:GNAT family N-acetyltransferase, partial [Burkholderia sp.]|uniref:GNAT family N-acetyltransferase n=2 Tax=Burkholderia sp. TaxID=36773 RepID=UPI002588E61B
AISDYASARHQHALMFVPVTQSDAETLVAIGAAVLREIFAKADEHRMPVRVCALRGSDANRFYARHGFVRTGEAEWDIDYRREPGAATT